MYCMKPVTLIVLQILVSECVIQSHQQDRILEVQVKDLQRTVNRQEKLIDQLLKTNHQQDLKIASLNQDIQKITKEKELATGIGFSAYHNADQSCQAGTVVQFNTEVTDIGDFYNNGNGIFVCPQDGIYLFSLSVDTSDGNTAPAAIIKDDNNLLGAYHGGSGHGQGSTTVITECNAFQSVWVECHKDGLIDAGREASFSGVLITPY